MPLNNNRSYCDLKRFFKNHHHEYYKFLKHAFCSDFIFDEKRTKCILIPNGELLKKIQETEKTDNRKAFEMVKGLVLKYDCSKTKFYNGNEVIVNISNKIIDAPSDLVKNTSNDNEYIRWKKDNQDMKQTKKDKNCTVVYMYNGKEVPKATKDYTPPAKDGKGVKSGGSSVGNKECVSALKKILEHIHNSKDSKESKDKCKSVCEYLLDALKTTDESLYNYFVKNLFHSGRSELTLYALIKVLPTDKLVSYANNCHAYTHVGSKYYDLAVEHPSEYFEKVKNERDLFNEKYINPFDGYRDVVSLYKKLFEYKENHDLNLHMLKFSIDELDLCLIDNTKEFKDNVKSLLESEMLNSLCNSTEYQFRVLKPSAFKTTKIEDTVVSVLSRFINSNLFLRVDNKKKVAVTGAGVWGGNALSDLDVQLIQLTIKKLNRYLEENTHTA